MTCEALLKYIADERDFHAEYVNPWWHRVFYRIAGIRPPNEVVAYTLNDILLLADILQAREKTIQLEDAGEWYTIPADYEGVSYG